MKGAWFACLVSSDLRRRPIAQFAIALILITLLTIPAFCQTSYQSGLSFVGHVYLGQPPSTRNPAQGIEVSVHGSNTAWMDTFPGTPMITVPSKADGSFELSIAARSCTYSYYHIIVTLPTGGAAAGARAGSYGSVINSYVVSFLRPSMGTYKDIAFWISHPEVQMQPDTSQQSKQESSQSYSEQSSEEMHVISTSPRTPDTEKKLPDTLLIGDFVLYVERYDKESVVTPDEKHLLSTAPTLLSGWNDLSGTAWLELPCVIEPPLLLKPLLPEGRLLIPRVYDVVPEVTDPQLEISLNDAKRFQPDISAGDQLTLKLQARDETPQSLLQAKKDLIQGIVGPSEMPASGIRVRFEAVHVVPVISKENTGRIEEGRAFYPAKPRHPEKLRITVDGFSAIIHEMELTPEGATADIELLLPRNIAFVEDCQRARLLLEDISFTPDCEFYREYASDLYGPWIIGNTGLIVTGTGYTVDFSSHESPPGKTLTWKGILLWQGIASGESVVPVTSNTGYLASEYSFTNATISSSGLNAQL